jgi:hypothetical protein
MPANGGRGGAGGVRRALTLALPLFLAAVTATSDAVLPIAVHFSAGAVAGPASAVPFGAFLGSGQQGADQVAAFDRWLGSGSAAAPRATVGHTYLPGDTWSAVAGDPGVLEPWAAWHRANPGSLLVVNVPLAAPNEDPVSDAEVAALLAQGAAGRHDAVFRTLAGRLVALGSGDAVLVPAWEMNGTTYADRCGPDPAAWKAYWRRVVTVMRAVQGARFRFDFDPNRGVDAVPWPQCYPGDAYVDIIGTDSYDQPPGNGFGDYVSQPYGLGYQVAFAAAHHKPVSYPEWGLYRHGDDPGFVGAMLVWIAGHDTVYQTITDYCPHGVFECSANVQSALVYRAATGHR